MLAIVYQEGRREQLLTLMASVCATLYRDNNASWSSTFGILKSVTRWTYCWLILIGHLAGETVLLE